MMANRWAASAAVAVLLLLSACSGDDGTAEVQPTGSPAPSVTELTGSRAPAVKPTLSPVAPPPAKQLARLELTATKVADGPELLTSIAWRPADPTPYLADQEGTV